MCKDFGLDPTGPAGPPPLTKGRLRGRIIGGVYKSSDSSPYPLLREEGLTARRGRGNIVAAGAADPTSSLPFPAGAGKASTRGRVGRGRRGCARLYPRSLSLALLDSSPYEGEPNLKGAAREGRGFYRLRAGRGIKTGRVVGDPPGVLG